jgi:hypothetical protein
MKYVTTDELLTPDSEVIKKLSDIRMTANALTIIDGELLSVSSSVKHVRTPLAPSTQLNLFCNHQFS